MLAQDLGEVPFDLQGERLIVYTPSEPRSVAEAKEKIKNFLIEIESDQLSHSPIAEIVAEHSASEGAIGAPSSPELVYLKHAVENVTYAISEHMLRLGDQIKESVGQAVKTSLQPREQAPESTGRLAILNTLNACGISNIYERRTDAYERIVSLIEVARERVDLMGISLRRFFHNDTEINEKIKHLDKHLIEWRVLVLDPETDQALYRSLREQETTYRRLLEETTFDYATIPRDQLFEIYGETYRNMMLCTDVDKTKRDIHFTLKQSGINIDLRFYKAAPACFLAFVDDFLFVEQYHYGATLDERVAEQVPVFECRRGSDMYRQMAGHFDHVWKCLSRDPDVSS